MSSACRPTPINDTVWRLRQSGVTGNRSSGGGGGHDNLLEFPKFQALKNALKFGPLQNFPENPGILPLLGDHH